MIPIGRGAGAGPDDAAAEMFRRGWVAGYAAVRAEVIAEIRRGVEGLAFEVPDEPSTSSRLMARALVNRDAVLALLPPTEPK